MKKTILLLSIITAMVMFGCKSDDEEVPEKFDHFDYTQEEKNAEIEKIRNYIKDNSIEGMTETEDGMFYRIEKKGEGLTGENFQDVTVSFEIKITSTGEIGFGHGDKDIYPNGAIWDFFGFEGLYEGIEDSIELINEGGEIFSIIPPYMHIGKNDPNTGEDIFEEQYDEIVTLKLELKHLIRYRN
ncbi:hypothetical protein [Aquimarina algiphila]|uniref:Uncharacterized protein n=1 Tax=Aquimarina algiphila TaxID=2047982 RepID=A0A554VRK6_9FLAO|nr:hypothetical protein [Aquimarina algiphila]TSE11287.1 hypothetical protein FOF46_01265 [Aquimarina algiphila]